MTTRCKKTILLFALASSALLSGCTPSEETDTESILQTALTNFTQNRSLTEQYVRDVKARLDPSDPAYVQAMESYQDARDTYNRFLDVVENGQKRPSSRSLRTASPLAVENSAADFIADATRAIKPGEIRHRGEFQRAVIVPEQLQSTFSKLPKQIRSRLIDRFDDQIRWRSWSQL
jgi:hypothetical protein